MSAELEHLLLLRPMQAEDRGFVASTWVQSYKDAPVPKAFLEGHARVVDVLLARCAALVLCHREDTSILSGWVCGSPSVLHYVYVPHDLRGNLLAKAMVSAAMGGYPALIPTSHKWPHHTARFAFNPYLAAVAENDNAR